MMTATASPFRYKSRAARIEAYVDAAQEIAAYRRAEDEDGQTPGRTRAILDALARKGQALREMTGGDLATAQRILLAAKKEAAR
jgi:hypothetical protein